LCVYSLSVFRSASHTALHFLVSDSPLFFNQPRSDYVSSAKKKKKKEFLLALSSADLRFRAGSNVPSLRHGHRIPAPSRDGSRLTAPPPPPPPLLPSARPHSAPPAHQCPQMFDAHRSSAVPQLHRALARLSISMLARRDDNSRELVCMPLRYHSRVPASSWTTCPKQCGFAIVDFPAP